MARGSMAVETTAFGTGAEILNRPPFKGVSMTIDFTDVTEDEKMGTKIVKQERRLTKTAYPYRQHRGLVRSAFCLWMCESKDRREQF